MSVSTSIAISTSAAVTATNANSVALRVKKDNCSYMMKGFKHEFSTIKEQRDYAECVDLLHPKELEPTEIIFLKLLFILGLIGAGCTFYNQKFYHGEDLIGATLLGLLGGAATVATLAATYGILWGVYWVIFL